MGLQGLPGALPGPPLKPGPLKVDFGLILGAPKALRGTPKIENFLYLLRPDFSLTSGTLSWTLLGPTWAPKALQNRPFWASFKGPCRQAKTFKNQWKNTIFEVSGTLKMPLLGNILGKGFQEPQKRHLGAILAPFGGPVAPHFDP